MEWRQVPEPGSDEIALLTLLAEGLTDEATMTRLGWSRRTFERRLKSVMSKLGAHSRFQAGFRVGTVGWIKNR